MNGNYIRSQSLPSYSFDSASKAFQKLGYIRGGYGQRIKGNITSGINQNRKINGKVSPHRGYDLGAIEGTNVRNCNMAGTAVLAGYLKDTGNYVVIQYENGTYARFMHLKNNVEHLKGKTILNNIMYNFMSVAKRILEKERNKRISMQSMKPIFTNVNKFLSLISKVCILSTTNDQ